MTKKKHKPDLRITLFEAKALCEAWHCELLLNENNLREYAWPAIQVLQKNIELIKEARINAEKNA